VEGPPTILKVTFRKDCCCEARLCYRNATAFVGSEDNLKPRPSMRRRTRVMKHAWNFETKDLMKRTS